MYAMYADAFNFIKKNYIYLLLLLWVFIFAFNPPLDLDLGWHLRYGQYFFQTGHVLKDNIISFVWPQYKWVQASWGFDLILYQLFDHFGFLGVSIAGAFFTFLVFFLVTYPFKRFTPFQFFILSVVFLSLTAPLYGSSMRSQTLSTVMFAIVMLIAYFQNRFIYTLPILFLIWTNLHGAFSLGLILLGVMWITQGLVNFVYHFKKKSVPYPKKQWLMFGLFTVLSCFTPLINPWGLRIYEESFKHASNTNLNVITEWMPLSQDTVATIVTTIIVLVTIGLLLARKKIKDLPLLIALVVVTVMAYEALRFIINLGVLITFCLALSFPVVKMKLKPLQTGLLKGFFIVLVLVELFFDHKFLSFPDPKALSFTWKDYCQIQGECSEEITQIMRQNPPKGNGYHPYNYGGYLSWRVPQVKTFVDGRMAAWEDNQGHTPPVIDGDRVVHEKNPFTFVRFDSQYHFQWAVVYSNSPITRYLDSLSKAGLWKKKYSDSYFSYYIKTSI